MASTFKAPPKSVADWTAGRNWWLAACIWWMIAAANSLAAGVGFVTGTTAVGCWLMVALCGIGGILREIQAVVERIEERE